MHGKGTNVVLLAHSWIKPFKNPSGEDFDRYELKINNKAAGLVKEWSEAVLFANWETFVKEDKRTKRNKGVSTGARILVLSPHADDEVGCGGFIARRERESSACIVSSQPHARSIETLGAHSNASTTHTTAAAMTCRREEMTDIKLLRSPTVRTSISPS